MSGVNFNDTAAKALISPVDLTSQVTGVLPIANGGSGTGTALTAGSVVFAGAGGTLSQDNANLFWDDTNNRLGVGTTTLNGKFKVAGAGYFAREASAFGTASVYTTLVLDGDTDGALYACGRANPVNAPFTALSGYDSTTDRILYYGGGGWSVPDATQHEFYTAPTYTETTDTGLLRMIILPSGFIGMGTGAPATRLHVVPTSAAAVGATIQGAAAQAGDLSQWQNSATTVLASVTSTGRVRIPDGTAALPAITPLSDTDTGIYSAGANSLGLSAGGAARLLINASNLSPQVAILHASAGAEATPVYSQASSTSSGMFFPGGATAALTGGGVEQVRVSASETTLQNGIKVKRTTSAAGAYTALVTDYYIGKTGITGGGDTVNLPAAATAGAGKHFVIKDEAGTAGTNNITVDPSGAETIDGAATFAINTNYGSATVVCSGTAWFVI